MAVIRDYNKLASDILREVGGEENINNFSAARPACVWY